MVTVMKGIAGLDKKRLPPIRQIGVGIGHDFWCKIKFYVFLSLKISKNQPKRGRSITR
jgi:hypothetical protein